MFSENIFQLAKEIPLPDIFSHYFPGNQLKKRGNRWTALCPLHNEKTGSFVIFPEGRFKCFGCHAFGDSISLLSGVYGIRPHEAALMIARDFGIPVQSTRRPLSRREVREAQAKAQEIARRRELETVFNNWCQGTYLKLCVIKRCIDKSIHHDPAFAEAIPGLLNLEPVFEHWLDILQNGTDEEKFSLFKEPAVKEWTTWNLI